jgi:hypothetical protein
MESRKKLRTHTFTQLMYEYFLSQSAAVAALRDEVSTITTIKWIFSCHVSPSLSLYSPARLISHCICVDMKTCERVENVSQTKKSRKSPHDPRMHFIDISLSLEIFKCEENHNIVACRIKFFLINTPQTMMYINYNAW